MNSIAELNTKWWYRLIKVCYIMLFLIIGAIPIIEIFIVNEPKFDNKASFVQCQNGTKLGLEEYGLQQYSEYMDKGKMKIMSLCVSDEDFGRVAKSLYAKYKEYPDRDVGIAFKKSISIDENIHETTENVMQNLARTLSKNYSLTEMYTSRNWMQTISYSLLALLAVTIVFEVLRRVFYYVVLGKLRPAK